MLRGDLDRVRIRCAGDRERRTIAGCKLTAAGRHDVDLPPLWWGDKGLVVRRRLEHRDPAQSGRLQENTLQTGSVRPRG
jgi:hypothetical protein